jgi:hypothetical protein
VESNRRTALFVGVFLVALALLLLFLLLGGFDEASSTYGLEPKPPSGGALLPRPAR